MIMIHDATFNIRIPQAVPAWKKGDNFGALMDVKPVPKKRSFSFRKNA